MKYSKQREMIFNYIKDHPLHMTADTIYEKLKKDNPTLSLGTVYRNLAQLVEHGMILKISMPGQPDRYDGNISGHFHFLCLDCNQIQDLFIDELSSVAALVAEKGDVKVEAFEMSFKGTCTACKSVS